VRCFDPHGVRLLERLMWATTAKKAGIEYIAMVQQAAAQILFGAVLAWYRFSLICTVANALYCCFSMSKYIKVLFKNKVLWICILIANNIVDSEPLVHVEDRMNGYGSPAGLKTLFAVCMTFVTLFACPGISSDLWRTLNGAWTAHRLKKVLRRKKVTGEKLKKYCEIDMKKLR